MNDTQDLARTIEEDVRRALAEDVGTGDLTAALIPAGRAAAATVISREEAVLCGAPWFDAVFKQLDPRVTVQWRKHDGETVLANEVLCLMQGPARALLTGERAALNFLQTLSGTASAARRYADAVRGTRARVLDTRKTLPGLRRGQKYATRCGGVENHRFGLFDAILIKENHIASAGSVGAAVAAALAVAGTAPVEVEVENLEQLREALAAGAPRILLDNFDIPRLAAAVRETRRRAVLEASGGIEFANIRAVAETGVDYISVGSITKHLRAADFSMRIER